MTFGLHLPIVIPYLKELQTVFLESKNLIFFLWQLEVSDFVYYFILNIFTSKITNLLFLLGAEGGGGGGGGGGGVGRDMPNKYIYDIF